MFRPVLTPRQVKLIQTGILPKYRNAKRLKVITGLFKPSLALRTVALCLHWCAARAALGTGIQLGSKIPGIQLGSKIPGIQLGSNWDPGN